jgi:ATP-dependent RNA circularization protein (DNA/RNA ligase family)
MSAYTVLAFNDLPRKGEELLHKLIVAEEKRDGVLVVIRFEVPQKLVVEVPEQYRKSLEQTVGYQHVVEMLEEQGEYQRVVNKLVNKNEIKHRYVIYGEFLPEGKSVHNIEPARRRAQFLIFDIFDRKTGRYVPFLDRFNWCYDYDLPMVRAIGYTVFQDLDELKSKVNGWVKEAKRSHKEGIVLKSYSDGQDIFVKVEERLI